MHDDQPLTELAASAIQLHELFRSYVDAGFTEPQAMQILTTILKAKAQGREQ